MKENPIIVRVALGDPHVKFPSVPAASKDIPICQFKIKDAEVLFYNGVDKHILHAVLAEMSKYAC